MVLRDETEDGRRVVRVRSVIGGFDTIGRLYLDALAAVMGLQ